MVVFFYDLIVGGVKLSQGYGRKSPAGSRGEARWGSGVEALRS